MTDFFLSHANNTEQNNHQEIVTERLNELAKLFPTSALVKSERALSFYHAGGKFGIFFFSGCHVEQGWTFD